MQTALHLMPSSSLGKPRTPEHCTDFYSQTIKQTKTNEKNKILLPLFAQTSPLSTSNCKAPKLSTILNRDQSSFLPFYILKIYFIYMCMFLGNHRGQREELGAGVLSVCETLYNI